jgi:hypothetical protein
MVDIHVLPPVLSSLTLEYIGTDDNKYLLGDMYDSKKCAYAAENGHL